MSSLEVIKTSAAPKLLREFYKALYKVVEGFIRKKLDLFRSQQKASWNIYIRIG